MYDMRSKDNFGKKNRCFPVKSNENQVQPHNKLHLRLNQNVSLKVLFQNKVVGALTGYRVA